MERLTKKCDFGLNEVEQIGYQVKDDLEGFYNIYDIARYADVVHEEEDNIEFNNILKNISIRLAMLEDREEPYKVIREPDNRCLCGKCGLPLHIGEAEEEYCPFCGQKTKW